MSNRRDFLKIGTLLGLSAAASKFFAAESLSSASSFFQADPPKLTLPALPYAINALEPFIDAETMGIHHGKHHQAYVDKLNTVPADQFDANLTLAES